MYYIIAIVVVVLAIAFYFTSKKASGAKTANANNSIIFIVGDKNAGKTSLLYCVLIIYRRIAFKLEFINPNNKFNWA